MRMIEFIRLILRHLVLLVTIPLLLAVLVIVLTKEPELTYSSSTVLYTGIATGSSIEMDKTFNYFATNSAFDNLINIIKSRETQEEVAIRLLSRHLLLEKANPKYISPKLYGELKKKIPPHVYQYVINASTVQKVAAAVDSSAVAGKQAADSGSLDAANKISYEATVASLTALMRSNDTNFIYKLLNYEDEHYSLKAISAVKVERIANSDMVKLSYESNDPGICQQTLSIFNDVCIKNYKLIKENRSDAVVKYFEAQLEKANVQLREAEDKLLGFNKANNIINYYEQSKAVAVVKEDMEVDYNNKKAQLAGTEAATRRLEEKLDIQQLVQLKSNSVLDKRKQLGDVNYAIAVEEARSETGGADIQKIKSLKEKAEGLKADIKTSVGELYSYQNSVEGLPVSTVLSQWINTVIESENLKARLKVMDQRNKEFQQQYAIYAPAGAHIKRIEREISVSEQGYLEILHGLNLAKLKLQDNELTSNLKAVDPPYYPLQSMPTKRAVLVIAAGMVGFLLVLGVILMMEYFDDTIRNAKRASKILQLPSAGMLPKIMLNPGKIHFPFVQERLVDMATQYIGQFAAAGHDNKTKIIVFLSTQPCEGKTTVAGNIARRLEREGKKVLLLNHSSLMPQAQQQTRLPFLNRVLGYADPRVDVKNKFLADPVTYLGPGTYYQDIDYSVKGDREDYHAILQQNNIATSFTPGYVFVELPALLFHNYPAQLIAGADMCVLVCRSNRLWTEADQSVINKLLPYTGNKLHCLVNGIELKEAEAVLGELPKKTCTVRKKIKNFFRFQFFSKNHI